MLNGETVLRILKAADLIVPENVRQAKYLQDVTGSSLYTVLFENELVKTDKALLVLSKHINTPCVSLKNYEGDPSLLDRVPRNLAEAYQCLPIGIMDQDDVGRLFLAMADPTDLTAMETINQVTGLQVEPVLVGPLDLRKAHERLYGSLSARGDSLPEEDEEFPTLDFSDVPDEIDDDLADLLADVGFDELEASPPRLETPPLASLTDSGLGLADSTIRKRVPLKTSDFRNFMSKSAVKILSPLEQEKLRPQPVREVGSKDLLEAVVRLLIRRGLVTEHEIMEEIADTRKKRAKGER